MDDYYSRLIDAGLKTRSVLNLSIERHPNDVILLSGGLDSSILAALNPTPAITVQIEDQGNDIHYAQIVAESLGIPWYPIIISIKEAIDCLSELVAIHNSFDLAIFNDIAILQGIKYARSLGFRQLCTGDGADMTFCGYQFLWYPGRIAQLEKLYPYMQPSAVIIGQACGLQISNPYLDPLIKDTVVSFPDDMLYNSFPEANKPGDVMLENAIKQQDTGFQEYGEAVRIHLNKTLAQTKQMWSKLALRFAARGMLPSEIVWRQKTDLQFGSGAQNIQGVLEETITNKEFQDFQDQGHMLYNKAHGALLKLFKQQELVPPNPKENEGVCVSCKGGFVKEKNHCATCGAYPASGIS